MHGEPMGWCGVRDDSVYTTMDNTTRVHPSKIHRDVNRAFDADTQVAGDVSREIYPDTRAGLPYADTDPMDGPTMARAAPRLHPTDVPIAQIFSRFGYILQCASPAALMRILSRRLLNENQLQRQTRVDSGMTDTGARNGTRSRGHSTRTGNGASQHHGASQPMPEHDHFHGDFVDDARGMDDSEDSKLDAWLHAEALQSTLSPHPSLSSFGPALFMSHTAAHTEETWYMKTRDRTTPTASSTAKKPTVPPSSGSRHTNTTTTTSTYSSMYKCEFYEDDPQLTPDGILQAADMATSFVRIFGFPATLFTSPMRRCVQTAEVIRCVIGELLEDTRTATAIELKKCKRTLETWCRRHREMHHMRDHTTDEWVDPRDGDHDDSNGATTAPRIVRACDCESFELICEWYELVCAWEAWILGDTMRVAIQSLRVIIMPQLSKYWSTEIQKGDGVTLHPATLLHRPIFEENRRALAARLRDLLYSASTGCSTPYVVKPTPSVTRALPKSVQSMLASSDADKRVVQRESVSASEHVDAHTTADANTIHTRDNATTDENDMAELGDAVVRCHVKRNVPYHSQSKIPLYHHIAHVAAMHADTTTPFRRTYTSYVPISSTITASSLLHANRDLMEGDTVDIAEIVTAHGCSDLYNLIGPNSRIRACLREHAYLLGGGSGTSHATHPLFKPATLPRHRAKNTTLVRATPDAFYTAASDEHGTTSVHPSVTLAENMANLDECLYDLYGASSVWMITHPVIIQHLACMLHGGVTQVLPEAMQLSVELYPNEANSWIHPSTGASSWLQHHIEQPQSMQEHDRIHGDRGEPMSQRHRVTNVLFPNVRASKASLHTHGTYDGHTSVIYADDRRHTYDDANHAYDHRASLYRGEHTTLHYRPLTTHANSSRTSSSLTAVPPSKDAKSKHESATSAKSGPAPTANDTVAHAALPSEPSSQDTQWWESALTWGSNLWSNVNGTFTSNVAILKPAQPSSSPSSSSAPAIRTAHKSNTTKPHGRPRRREQR